MRALVREDDAVALRTIQTPEVGPGQIAVRVGAAGICRTDIYIADGRLAVTPPMTLGHEGAGTIETIGSEGPFEVGMRVAINPLLACGTCAACQNDAKDDCRESRMLGLDAPGLFADVVIVPMSSLIRIPDGVTTEEAAYLEPVAASLAVLDTGITPHERGTVFGRDRIANLTRRILEIHGFDALVSPEDDDGGLDFVVETLATTETMDDAVRRLRPGGRLVLKSRPSNAVPMPIKMIVEKQLTLIGARYGDFDASMALMATGQLSISSLIGGFYGLDSYEEAFRVARADPLHKFMFRM